MANYLKKKVKNAVQNQIPVKLGKETVTKTVNAQEILYVELIIVNLYLDMDRKNKIAVKRVRHCACGKTNTNLI